MRTDPGLQVNHAISHEISNAVAHAMERLGRDVSSRLSSELGGDAQRIRTAAEATEARVRELGRMHEEIARELARAQALATASTAVTASASGGVDSGGGGVGGVGGVGGPTDSAVLTRLNGDLAMAHQQLGQARAEAAYWQRLHGVEAARARELELSAARMQARLEQLESRAVNGGGAQPPEMPPRREMPMEEPAQSRDATPGPDSQSTAGAAAQVAAAQAAAAPPERWLEAVAAPPQ